MKKIKRNYVIAIAVAILSAILFNSPSSATTFQHIQPANYGSYFNYGSGQTYIESTNSETPPYLGWVEIQRNGPSYERSALMEFNINTIPSFDKYYLALSPASIYWGNGLPSHLDVYSYVGDGLISISDFGSGTYSGTTYVNQDTLTWYTPNIYNDYLGTTYFDVTNFVNNYKTSGNQFLGLNIRSGDEGLNGVLFRGPTLLALNGELQVSPVPIPSTMILFGSSLVALVGFGKRRLKK